MNTYQCRLNVYSYARPYSLVYIHSSIKKYSFKYKKNHFFFGICGLGRYKKILTGNIKLHTEAGH